MKRQYTALADTGRDYISFEFYSEHRANSKANIEDAQNYYKRNHGHKVNVMETIYNKEEIC